MNETDTRKLLAYLQAADNRNVGDADIAFWMDTLPGWLDLDTAKAAVRMFFTEPERNASESVYFTTRHLIRCAKAVRRAREVEAARRTALTPALTAAYRPPAEGWRARVPGGYAEGPENGTDAPEEPHVFTDEERAANRRRLAAIMAHGPRHPDHPDHEHEDCCK